MSLWLTSHVKIRGDIRWHRACTKLNKASLMQLCPRPRRGAYNSQLWILGGSTPPTKSPCVILFTFHAEPQLKKNKNKNPFEWEDVWSVVHVPFNSQLQETWLFTALDTASKFPSNACIRCGLGWRRRGTWSPRNWSEGSIRPKSFLGSIPRPPGASNLPFEVTSDAGIRGQYAGSRGIQIRSCYVGL